MRQIDNNELHFDGTLSVWHIPQVPGEPFRVLVTTPLQGKQLMDLLAAYDFFEFSQDIKPDYANANGLNVWEGEGWVTWENFEDGYTIDDYVIKDGKLVLSED